MYAFILGRTPEISIAELGAFFPDLRVPGHKAAVFTESLPDAFTDEPQKFLNRLGGSTEILKIVKSGLNAREILSACADWLREKCAGKSGKCDFALNLIPESRRSELLRITIPALKKMLRAEGVRANFMNKDISQNVSPVLAAKRGLIESGTNLSVIEEGEGKFCIGATVSLQDIDNYSRRDYGKPFRDPNSGMLPPKLAQVMINLCHPELVSGSFTVVDPFCGTGTILMEAMLMGYSVIGSDKDTRTAEGAKKNIKWLKENFKIAQNVTDNIFCAPADSDASAAKIDRNASPRLGVVTEPYLGPPLTDFPAPAYLERLRAELTELYLNFFKNMKNRLPKGAPVVFIFPYWKKPDGTHADMQDCIDKIIALGYSKTAFAPLQKDLLKYDRPGQTVGREIVRFIPE